MSSRIRPHNGSGHVSKLKKLLPKLDIKSKKARAGVLTIPNVAVN